MVFERCSVTSPAGDISCIIFLPLAPNLLNSSLVIGVIIINTFILIFRSLHLSSIIFIQLTNWWGKTYNVIWWMMYIYDDCNIDCEGAPQVEQ